MTQEEINRILVEAEGGCFHKTKLPSNTGAYHECKKCGHIWNWLTEDQNPDFSKWENFGRLLKVAEKHGITELSMILVKTAYIRLSSYSTTYWTSKYYGNIDQIPALVSAELAKIIENNPC